MNPARWVVRILKLSVLALCAVLVALTIFIQSEQWLLRWRMSRLMREMHAIRLYQSNWSDAQRMMTRWGAWGNYEGSCTPEDCFYSISLTNLTRWNRGSIEGGNRLVQWMVEHDHHHLTSLLGLEPAILYVDLRVASGIVVREGTGLMVSSISPIWDTEDDFGFELIVDAKSRPRLRQTEKDGWILGQPGQLAQHPNYIVGRLGGCTFCIEAQIVFSTRTPPDEIRQLTSFDLSCVTRTAFNRCTKLDEVLHNEGVAHVYDDNQESYQPPQLTDRTPKPCDIPLWALARDAPWVLTAEATAVRREKVEPTPFAEIPGEQWRQVVRVATAAVLKGSPPWPAGSKVEALPFSGNAHGPMSYDGPPYQSAEEMEAGGHYILIPLKNERRDDPQLDVRSPIDLDRCGVFPDTSENRRLVERGLQLDDELPGPERR